MTEQQAKKILYILTSLAIVLSVLAAFIFTMYHHSLYYKLGTCKEYYDVSKKADSDEITVMSFNIHGFTTADRKEKSYYTRAPLMIKLIKENEPDIINFQETGNFEELFFKAHLLGYTFINSKSGLVTAFRNDRFSLLEYGKFWLSDTPDVESFGWDAACIRTALYSYILDNKTNKTYTITNTHLDHVGEQARINGIKLILEKMESLSSGTMILCGDMNDFVGGEMYEEATKTLNDAQLVAKDTYLGPGATYHSYGRILKNARIDYFFLTPDIEINSYIVIDRTFDGIYPSDHFPILMKIAQ